MPRRWGNFIAAVERLAEALVILFLLYYHVVLTIVPGHVRVSKSWTEFGPGRDGEGAGHLRGADGLQEGGDQGPAGI